MSPQINYYENDLLTKREGDVVQEILRFNTTDVGIATKMNISPLTVQDHLTNVKVKIEDETGVLPRDKWNIILGLESIGHIKVERRLVNHER